MLLLPLVLGLIEKLDPKVPVLLPRSEGDTVELLLEEGEGAGRCSAATFNLLAEGDKSPALIASRLVSTDTNEYHMLYTALPKTVLNINECDVSRAEKGRKGGVRCGFAWGAFDKPNKRNSCRAWVEDSECSMLRERNETFAVELCAMC